MVILGVEESEQRSQLAEGVWLGALSDIGARGVFQTDPIGDNRSEREKEAVRRREVAREGKGGGREEEGRGSIRDTASQRPRNEAKILSAVTL